MKKTLTILLVLVVAMGFLFADTTNTLLLKAKKEPINKIGFMATAPATFADAFSGTAYTGTPLPDASGAIEIKTGSQAIGAAVYKTTSAVAVTVSLSSDKFTGYTANTYTGTTNGSEIGYTMSFGTAVLKTAKGDANSLCTAHTADYTAGGTAITLFSESNPGVAGRFGAIPLTIAMNSDDVTNALEGYYLSTVTITTASF